MAIAKHFKTASDVLKCVCYKQVYENSWRDMYAALYRVGEQMSFYAAIKKNAKAALKGRWSAAAGACLFVVGVAGALMALEYALLRALAPMPSLYWHSGPADHAYFLRVFFGYSPREILVTCIAAVLYTLFLAPLILGGVRWSYVLVQGCHPAFSELFYFFGSGHRYGRAIWLNLQTALRCLGWGIVFLSLPAGLFSICVRFLLIDAISRATRVIASVGLVVAFGLFVMMAIFYAIYINRYALGGYLLCESDEITVRQALRASTRYTKGYRGVKFLFTLSFLGWYLLVPVTFFIAMVFVLPYHIAGETVLARYLVERNREELAQDTREFGSAALG